MGLFSSIFGGGGGSSSSSSTKVVVKVNPTIRVNNDLTPIQKAIEQISGIQSEQFKTLEESQQQAAAAQQQATVFNALALDSFLETLKGQQTVALIALGGVALWVLTR